MLNKKEGITLISLVITIIVLLILAGISITTLTGNNGLITKAMEAKEQTEVAEVKEMAQLDILDWQANQLADNNDSTLNEDIVKGILDGKDYIAGFNEDDPDNIKVITKNGYEFPISDLYYQKGNTPPPAGEDEVKEGEDFTDSNGNEWVWIEVPKTAEVYKTAGLNITNFTDDEYTKIYEDLASYAGTYRDEENKGTATGTDEWYDGCGLEQSKYYELKKKMLKSIYENEGFHIGKYEVGIEEEGISRTSEGDPITEIPVIQPNKVVYNYVTILQAQKLSEKLAVGEKTSSLMFGIQWDLVLKYIETQGENTEEGTLIDQTLIKSDSTKWGNYQNATFNITNTNAKYSEDKGVTYNQVTVEEYPKPSLGRLLTTGAAERNNTAGIYDLAGNIWEWTLEKTTYADTPSSNRGGYYNDYGSTYSASYRNRNSISISNDGIGFRPALY